MPGFARRCGRRLRELLAEDRRGGVLLFFGLILVPLVGFAGLAISTWPYLVPRALTIFETAAAPESQIFSLIGVLVMLPIILGYFVFVYWTFRGKLRPGDGYH